MSYVCQVCKSDPRSVFADEDDLLTHVEAAHQMDLEQYKRVYGAGAKHPFEVVQVTLEENPIKAGNKRPKDRDPIQLTPERKRMKTEEEEEETIVDPIEAQGAPETNDVDKLGTMNTFDTE